MSLTCIVCSGCAQVKITGGGSANPPKIALPGAYKSSDPGITVNIYNNLQSYTAWVFLHILIYVVISGLNALLLIVLAAPSGLGELFRLCSIPHIYCICFSGNSMDIAHIHHCVRVLYTRCNLDSIYRKRRVRADVLWVAASTTAVAITGARTLLIHLRRLIATASHSRRARSSGPVPLMVRSGVPSSVC